MSMKILLWDAETGPNLAYVWGLWKQNVSLNQIAESGDMLCWAAKWRHEKRIHFNSVNKTNRREMLEDLHALLDEADVVVHYNGKQFDTKWANRCFLEEGMMPPSPYKEVDLLAVVRRQFKFPSNKLQYVAQKLGLGEKEKHEGFDLWLKCLEGNRDAWRKMRKYNIQDVRLLEELYVKLLPWINNHPLHGAYGEDGHVCPRCGSRNVIRRGVAKRVLYEYPRYSCKDCGAWSQGSENLTPSSKSRNTLRNA